MSRKYKYLTLFQVHIFCNLDRSHTNSTAKVVFLSWLLREISSFKDAENYGLYTQKELREMHEARSQKPLSTERPFLLITFIFRFIFFGIPWTYFTQIQKSLEFKGRLIAMQSNWQSYIERLAREYSQFLLIVSTSNITYHLITTSGNCPPLVCLLCLGVFSFTIR